MSIHATEHRAAQSRFDEWVDAAIHVEPELGLVQLDVDGGPELLWSDNIAAVAAAAADAGGPALWCEKYSKLMIPSSRLRAGNRFFTLSRLETRADAA